MNYHNADGTIQYEVPEELQAHFAAELPRGASEQERSQIRGTIIEQADELTHFTKESPGLPETALTAIYLNYTQQGFFPEDFILAAWDLVRQCQIDQVLTEPLVWEDSRELEFDPTMNFSHGFDWFGWRYFRLETIGFNGQRYAIWPDQTAFGQRWSAYGGKNGAFAYQAYRTQIQAEAAVARWSKEDK